jgi:transcriptional regulator with XRE-family HTH domain
MHVGRNVASIRDTVFNSLPTPTQRNRQLAKDASMSESQVERVISGSLGTSIDYIEQLAAALRVRPQDLLTPYFHLEQEQQDASQATSTLRSDRELRRQSR